MRSYTMKTILNISDVFSLMHRGIAKSDTVTLPSGQVIPMSNNLIRLYHKGDLTCSECGCCGTHLQQFFTSVQHAKTHEVTEREIWRVMSYNKHYNTPTFLNLDHIIPKSRGGTWDGHNIRVTCEICNCYRSDKPIVDEYVDGKPTCSLSAIITFLKTKFAKTRNLKVRLQHLQNIVVKRIRHFGMTMKRATWDALSEVLKNALKQIGLPNDKDLLLEIAQNILPA